MQAWLTTKLALLTRQYEAHVLPLLDTCLLTLVSYLPHLFSPQILIYHALCLSHFHIQERGIDIYFMEYYKKE